MSNTEKKKSLRNGEVELLRFLFAVMVVLRHAKPFVLDGITLYFQRGALAVDFFFIVSGYLMACSAKKSASMENPLSIGEDTFQFMRKKFCGLMPEFLIAAIISFAISQIGQRKFGIGEIFNSLRIWIWEIFPLSMAGFTEGKFHMAAWYISAMLLAMFILYPLCRKHFDAFTRIIAPLIAIFVIGYMADNFGSVLGPTHRIGTTIYRGLLRSIAEISLGAACFVFIEWFKKLQLTRLAKALVTICNSACLLMVFGWMIFGTSTKYDIVCVALITVSVCMAFSHQGILADKLDHPLPIWLGKMSMLIYMCHAELPKLIKREYERLAAAGTLGQNPMQDYILMLAIYFISIVIIVFVVYQISKWIRKHQKKIGEKLSRLLIVQS